MDSYDLIVIGGGPAGTAAAITAARSGVRVLLLEKGCFPRHKVCGEFVSAESLELLSILLAGCESSLSLLQRAPRIECARIFADDAALDVPVQPAAASIARFELDDALCRAAHSAGVEVRQQQAVQQVRGARFVSTASHQFEARCIINATGRWSNLTNGDLENRASRKWLGLKAHFLEPEPELSVALYFFKGGYCGVQPVTLEGDHESRINVCAMVRTDFARSLPEVLSAHAALRQRSVNWQPLMSPIATFPLILGPPQPRRSGVLMAGDAAGFVDPFIGDGISLALRSGSLAAQSLKAFLDGKTSLEEAAREYHKAYSEEILPVFRASSNIRRLFALPRTVRSGLLKLFGNAPALTRYLVHKTRAAQTRAR
jgi:flavin-dependent dehydrogenase